MLCGTTLLAKTWLMLVNMFVHQVGTSAMSPFPLCMSVCVFYYYYSRLHFLLIVFCFVCHRGVV